MGKFSSGSHFIHVQSESLPRTHVLFSFSEMALTLLPGCWNPSRSLRIFSEVISTIRLFSVSSPISTRCELYVLRITVTLSEPSQWQISVFQIIQLFVFISHPCQKLHEIGNAIHSFCSSWCSVSDFQMKSLTESVNHTSGGHNSIEVTETIRKKKWKIPCMILQICMGHFGK